MFMLYSTLTGMQHITMGFLIDKKDQGLRSAAPCRVGSRRGAKSLYLSCHRGVINWRSTTKQYNIQQPRSLSLLDSTWSQFSLAHGSANTHTHSLTSPFLTSLTPIRFLLKTLRSSAAEYSIIATTKHQQQQQQQLGRC